MQDLKYILAHGSSNLFVMIDAVAQKIETNSDATAEYVREVCQRFASDGLLFVEQDNDGYYAMNMYNTDGTQAEMCGNGMRIVARYVDQQYLNQKEFTLFSGGKPYPIIRALADKVTLANGSEARIPNYGVSIAIQCAHSEFTLSNTTFIDQPIEELHPTLRFTYLNLGNPHIIALVENIDLDLLSQLGNRVKELTEIFTRGVNVSLMQPIADGQIFVATYERGVGLTASCGTAMTASSTTAALLGVVEWQSEILVRNRGGFVKCVCSKDECGQLTTRLIGNATYIESGTITSAFEIATSHRYDSEIEAWERLTK